MKQLLEWLAFAVFLVVLTNIARAQRSQPAAPRVVDLKSTDGTVRKGAFYTAARPGPGVVLPASG
jgi:hypothetical protein